MEVAIIGAGPCGMAAARALLQEGFSVTLFEKRPEFGGVWLYDGKGPMYKELNTNLQSNLMMFKDHEFPPGLPRFPLRQDVLEYVQSYSRTVAAGGATAGATAGAAVKFGVCIEKVQKIKEKWVLNTGSQEFQADFLVVAAGHCEYPLYPPIRGLNTEDKRVMHSRYFNDALPFTNKKVLIVGNASSAVDLAIHILAVTPHLHISRRREGAQDHLFEGLVEFVPEIKEIHQSGVTFLDSSRLQPDVILFCTGYLYQYPFLEEWEGEVLHEKRLRLRNLYRNCLYNGDPSLAFVAMDKNIVPMPLSECQAAAIARVWSGRLALPSKEEMRRLEAEKVALKGDGTAFHFMKTPEDTEYMLELVDWAASAGPGGFLAERWSPEKLEERKEVAATKSKDIKRRLDEIRQKRN